MKSLYLVALTVGLLQSAEVKIVADLQGLHARHRSVVGNVTDDVFEKMALEFLGPKEVAMGTFILYGSVEDRVVAGPRGFDHCSYSHWRATVDDFARSHSGCPAIKEAMKIGPSIFWSCSRGGLPPCEPNPAGDVQSLVPGVEILALQLGPFTSTSKEQRIAVNCFARTHSPITADLAKALTSQLVTLTGADSIGVELRDDAWSVTNCGFPAIYPFEDRGKIPTLVELSRVSSEVGPSGETNS